MKVGVVIRLGAAADRPARPYVELRELAQATEAAGLDSIWITDHLRPPCPPPPTSWHAPSR